MQSFDYSYPTRVHFGEGALERTLPSELSGFGGDTVMVAFGGGSVIDCCKVIAVQAVTEGDIWELEFKRGILSSASLPLGAVVTASGTGAEMNAGAVIINEALGVKTGVFGVAYEYPRHKGGWVCMVRRQKRGSLPS